MRNRFNSLGLLQRKKGNYKKKSRKKLNKKRLGDKADKHKRKIILIG